MLCTSCDLLVDMSPSHSLSFVSSDSILTIKRGDESKRREKRRADPSPERRVRAPSAVKDKQLL